MVELALITGLAAAGGPRAMVAAAVLIFRALTYVLPIPIGAGHLHLLAAQPVVAPARRTPLPAPTWCRRRCEHPGAGPAGRVARGWPDVVLVAAGAAVLRPGRAAGRRRAGCSDAEAAVFRVLNGTTVLPFVVVWPVMQLGNVLVVPVSAAVAAALPPVAAGRSNCWSRARRRTCWPRW